VVAELTRAGMLIGGRTGRSVAVRLSRQGPADPLPPMCYMQSKGGRRKVLFGTDYPMIAAQKALEDLDALGLNDEARELFPTGNAARVFKLTASAAS
jgi:predicted TIM-barrel fold metal-dependent hydrolase